jgi:dihydroorotate dehydrogenase
MSTVNIVGSILGKISKDPYKIFAPFLSNSSPELIKKVQHFLIKEGVFATSKKNKTPKALRQQLWGRVFPSPIGISSGYDTKITVSDFLCDMGFGFSEVGTVTCNPDKITKRAFYSKKDKAIIDQTPGFLCEELHDFVLDLSARRGKRGIVGTSIGETLKNFIGDETGKGERIEPIEQYEIALKAVAPYSDFVTINVSNSNMAGLAEYQIEQNLNELLKKLRVAINKAAPINTPALLLKMSADVSDVGKEITAKCALANQLDGIIVAGGTKKRFEGMSNYLLKTPGCMFGKPTFEYSTHLIKEMYYHTQAQIPIIGCGGIFDANDVYKKIRAGASLTQVYTGIIVNGPGMIKKMNEQLANKLRADGFNSVSEAIGADMR